MEEWQPDKEVYLKPDSEKFIKQDIEKYFKADNRNGTRHLDPEPSPKEEDYESEDDLMPEMENLEPGTLTF